MKAAVVLFAVIAFASVAALGQGQFLFNTRNLSAGNNVPFFLRCEPASGTDLFVKVLAGPDANNLMPLTPLLPLNRTGAGAGYTNPFGQIYTVPGMEAGTAASVGYRAFQGTSYAEAASKSQLMFALSPVVLTAPPSVPNEAVLGSSSIPPECIPEPSAWALFLLGLGALIWRFRAQ
jgi:hypothetical protein